MHAEHLEHVDVRRQRFVQVVNDQRPQATGFNGFRAGGQNALAAAERHFDPEGAAMAEFAIDTDAAAHHFGQTPGNGQPEAGAAVFPGC